MLDKPRPLWHQTTPMPGPFQSNAQADFLSADALQAVRAKGLADAFRVGLLAVVVAMPSLCAQDKFAELRQQDQKMIREAPGARFDVRVGQPVPNVELPAHVVATEHAVTLFADFENAGQRGVPLYLVNRSGRPLELDAQDGDPYLKLEYRNEKGQWTRAQPHLSSWCGNSYYPVTLASGQHFCFYGYQALEGTPATVRYRCVGNAEVVSNLGSGRVNPVDLAAAAMDDLAANSIPMALREVLDASRRIYSMRKITPEFFAAAMRLLSHYQESPYYRREARRYLESLDRKLPEAAAINGLLDQSWPVEPDRMGLLKHVHAVISGMEPDVSPSDKELALKVARDLLMDSREETNAGWRQVVGRIFGQIAESMDQWGGGVAEAASGVIAVPDAVDEFLETDKLRDWLEHGNLSVVEASANILSRRGDWSFLAGKGFQLSPQAQILVLKSLAAGSGSKPRNYRNPESAREREFWKHCAALQSVNTVRALQYIGPGGSGRHFFNMVLHDPLRDFLEQEADLAEKDPQAATNEEHGYPVAQVIQFVGAWQRKEDIPLFRRFLKHPGFQSSISHESSGRRFEVRRFRVREDAKNVLHSMRVFVPDDVVLEEKIPLPDKPDK